MADGRLTTMHNALVLALTMGKISEDEKHHIERVRDRLGISAQEFKQLVEEVRQGSRQIRLPASPAEAQHALQDLIDLTQADGRIDPVERHVLEKIAHHLGLSDEMLDGMLNAATGANEQEIQGKLEEIYLHLGDWSGEVRQSRFAELERFGRAAVLPLLRMLESYRAPDGAADALELKVFIVDTLAALGDRRAIYYLATQVALSENSEVSNDAVRFAAAAAIGRLTGGEKPFTRDAAGVAAVRQWWTLEGIKDYNTLAL
jgi:uncharacterized tellurite resistance protein B-like protein